MRSPAELPRRTGQTLPLFLQAPLVRLRVCPIRAGLRNHCPCKEHVRCYHEHIRDSFCSPQINHSTLTHMLQLRRARVKDMTGFIISYSSTCRAEGMWWTRHGFSLYGFFTVESRSTGDARIWAWVGLVFTCGTWQGQGRAFRTVVALWDSGNNKS